MKKIRKKIFLLIIFLIYFKIYCYNFDYLYTLEGHKSSVGCISISYDSRYLVTGSFDTTIKIWDLNTKNIINTIIYGAIVESLSFSQDNKLLASAGRDKKIKIWEVKTGNLLQTYGPFNDFIFCVTFTPDNKNIIIGSFKYIYFFNIKNNKITNKIDIGNIWARSIKFSPDGNYLGIAGGNEVQIYNVKNNNDLINKLLGKNIELKKLSFYKLQTYVYSIDFSNDSQYFAFGCDNGEVYLYRTIDGFFMWSKKIYSSLIWSVAFSNSGFFAVAGRDKDIILLDIKTGNIVKILSTDCNENFSVVFSYNDKYLASSGKDAKIRVWNCKNNHIIIYKNKYFFIVAGFLIVFFILIFFKFFQRKSTVKEWKL